MRSIFCPLLRVELPQNQDYVLGRY